MASLTSASASAIGLPASRTMRPTKVPRWRRSSAAARNRTPARSTAGRAAQPPAARWATATASWASATLASRARPTPTPGGPGATGARRSAPGGRGGRARGGGGGGGGGGGRRGRVRHRRCGRARRRPSRWRRRRRRDDHEPPSGAARCPARSRTGRGARGRLASGRVRAAGRARCRARPGADPWRPTRWSATARSSRSTCSPGGAAPGTPCRDQFADGHVDAGAIAEIAQRPVQRRGHAVEHLALDGAVGQTGAVGGGEGVGEAAHVVAGERRADVARPLPPQAGTAFGIRGGGGPFRPHPGAAAGRSGGGGGGAARGGPRGGGRGGGGARRRGGGGPGGGGGRGRAGGRGGGRVGGAAGGGAGGGAADVRGGVSTLEGSRLG